MSRQLTAIGVVISRHDMWDAMEDTFVDSVRYTKRLSSAMQKADPLALWQYAKQFFPPAPYKFQEHLVVGNPDAVLVGFSCAQWTGDMEQKMYSVATKWGNFQHLGMQLHIMPEKAAVQRVLKPANQVSDVILEALGEKVKRTTTHFYDSDSE